MLNELVQQYPVLGYLAWWGIAGFIAVTFTKIPIGRGYSNLHNYTVILLLGPLSWLLITVIAILYIFGFYKNR
jgi:hypothetical protein